jgi:hypothetical protein
MKPPSAGNKFNLKIEVADASTTLIAISETTWRLT